MSKVCTLSEAISKFVKDGDHIVFGGFTTNRKPYAAIHEILRQGLKDFVGEGGPAGGDWDLLIGEGRVLAYTNCYTANSGVTNVSRRFREAYEKGTLNMEDYSQDAIMLMLHAASLGLPFLPVRLMLGTDIAHKWGISKEVRKTIPKLPADKFVYVENPFKKGETVMALPVPEIDVAVIHVQKASFDGTCSIEGDEFHDVDIAVASKRCIVTCEELVSDEEIRKNPEANSVPGFCVDAVVHAPYGAHPSQCYNYYDYDNPFLRMYDGASKTAESFAAFVKEWVYDVPDHYAYLDKLGASRLLKLKAVPGLGYSKDMTKEAKKNG
ncbi:MAG: glutaconate CoA-transferase [Fusobacteriaceae bacterium]|jgi:glutaconate CoA-transferase subunit A|nr:glutaconate CoA-transferase [Fusobacteriaceae bacterium]